MDIDPNESPDLLRAHSERYGFNWPYAISPVDVTRAIVNDYGQSYLNPPNVPMLLIRPDNSIVEFPFGVKSAEQLASFVDANR